MKELLLDEIKRIELEMLIYIDKLCRENNINYSLDGGTLLGAVRHNGFIPWDDDIDIFLLRKDFDRLMEILKRDDRYDSFIPGETDNYFYGFAKLADKNSLLKGEFENKLGFAKMGVFIDIFVHDNIYKSDVIRMMRRVRKFQRFAIVANKKGSYYYSDSKKKELLKRIFLFPAHLVLSLMGSTYWIGKAENEAKLFSENDVEYLADFFGNLTVKGSKKYLLPRKMYDDFTELEFEGHSFKAISNYRNYLRILYGDYMQLPPEEERVVPHKYQFYRI